MTKIEGRSFNRRNLSLQVNNPIGEWFEKLLNSHPELTKSGIGQRIDLPGISGIHRLQPESVSGYTIGKLLSGIDLIDGVSPDEKHGLLEAVEKVRAEQLRLRGKVNDRIPPGVARYEQRKLGDDVKTYRDAEVARDASVKLARVRRIRLEMGISAYLYGEEVRQRIKDRISEENERSKFRKRATTARQERRQSIDQLLVGEQGSEHARRLAEYNALLSERKRQAEDTSSAQDQKPYAQSLDFITPSYLNSLTPSDRPVVEKLRGTSLGHGAKITGDDRYKIEYMMQMGDHPPGATIKRNALGEYYLEPIKHL